MIINDNLTSVLLARPAVLLVLPLAKFNFDILVLRKDLYCILLLSVMPADAVQKNMMKFGWLEAEIWEFYSRRYFRQDIVMVKLSLIDRKKNCFCCITFSWICHQLFHWFNILLFCLIILIWATVGNAIIF